MPERVHGKQRRCLRRVTEVVAVRTARERGARGGLHRDDADVLAGDLVLQEREGQASEVGATTHAADDHVGVGARHLHLLLGLFTDHRLVKQDVVEHRPEGVVGVVVHRSLLNGLADCDAQGSR